MLHVPTELPTLQEVLYWLYYDATKPQVTKNNICEGTDHLNAALSSGMTSLQAMVASARSVSWGSNEAVTLLYLVPWPSTQTCRVKTQYSKHYDSHHRPDAPFTQYSGIAIYRF